MKPPLGLVVNGMPALVGGLVAGLVVGVIPGPTPVARAEISTSQQDGTSTEGWDGPGLGAATIDWYLGWPTATCNTSGGTGYTGDVTTAEVEEEVVAAMQTWSSVVDVTWNKVGDALQGCFNGGTDPFDCDGIAATQQVNIVWNRGNHCDGAASAFDGAWNPSLSSQPNIDGHVFAHSWGPPDIWSWIAVPAFIGNIHLDDDESWVTSGASSLGPGTTATTASVDIRSEVLHELGHVLGLAHTTSANAVMNPLKWVLERRALTAFDVSEIQSLYAPAETDGDVVLLLDTSGSMSWAPDGTPGVPVAEQRLTLAKNAALPFLDLLEIHAGTPTDFGIARFPRAPSASGGCLGQVVGLLSPANAANVAQGKTLIQGLAAQGMTPLLAGLQSAVGMLGSGTNRAIVLLSDGYHNCPSAEDAGSPALTAVIQQLGAAAVRVYTIGFGRPSDVDHPLLERLAAETAGAFYDVTTPGFDPAAWTPATALQDTYKAILVDALGLQSVIDPLARVAAGETIERELSVSALDDRVTVYVSWATPAPERLEVALVASDGSAVSADGAAGVQIRQGATYKVISAGRDFLARPGKVGTPPWKLTIRPAGLKAGQSEALQYSVLLDSRLRLTPGIRSAGFHTGSKLLLTAALTAGGKPVTGVGDVHVTVARPAEGLGSWHAKHRVSARDLGRVTATSPEGAPLPPLARKLAFLADVAKVARPARTSSGKLRMYDDGTHGDVRADDGVYSVSFEDTRTSGTYEMVFTAAGRTGDGVAFRREARLGPTMAARFDAQASEVAIVPHDDPAPAKDRTSFQVTVTPKDALGNHLGPGLGSALSLHGRDVALAAPFTDNLDGSYSARISVPAAGPGLALDVGFRDDVKHVAIDRGAHGTRFYQGLSLLLMLAVVLLVVLLIRKQSR
jgi:hypothetical protein